MLFKDLAELLTFSLNFLFYFTVAFFTCNALRNEALNLTKTNASTTIFFLSPLTLCGLFTPLLSLAFISVFLFRTYEGVVLFGYFSLSSWSYAWLLCITSLFIFGAYSLRQWSHLWRINALNEILLALAFLTYFWYAIVLVRSIFSFLLFLELAGLGLLIVFTKAAESENTHNASTQANVLQTSVLPMIAFLWTSIISILLLLLGLVLSSEFSQFQLDLFKLNVVFTPLSYLNPNLILLLAVFLKLMLIPWQGILFSYYKSLPVGSFALYLSFYYPAFLIIAPLFLVPLLLAAGANVIIFWFSGLTLALLSVASLLTQAVDFRVTLAISSLFNLLLFVTLLLV